MADILNTAQGNNPLPASPPPDDVLTAPTASQPPPQANPPDVLPPEPSPQPEETESIGSASPSDSLIVPRKEGHKLTESAPVQEKSPPPPIVPVREKKSPVGVILAVLLLLLITLPLAVYFITQQKQLTDLRSRASGVYPGTCSPSPNAPAAECQGVSCNATSESSCNSYCCTWTITPCETMGGTCLPSCTNSSPISGRCPGESVCCSSTPTYTCLQTKGQYCSVDCHDGSPGSGKCPQGDSCCIQKCPALGGTCSSQGAECNAGDKGHYCCVKSWSGSITWQPKTWATCPADIPSCPWTETNGQCCPSSVDACDYTKTDQKCINDPFISHCEKWGDGTCPGGGGRWAGGNYYTDCTTEGCGNTGYICVQGAMHDANGKSYNLCRNPACPSSPDCICGGTGTPPPSSPSASPTPGGQCTNIEVYKDGTLVTDFSTLAVGDVIAVWVKGTNATKAHVRINGGTFTETTTQDNTNTWFIVPDITIPSGVSSVTIESEVYVNGVWQ